MTPRAEELITLTPQGLYCPPGDFHIDPLRPVSRAVVTHGHADHARPGHTHVLATAETLDIMALRYGENFAQTTQRASYGEVLRIGDVDLRFVPAGHVLGSAQIVIERGGLRLVITGDYKRGEDPTCAAFECVPCDVFVSEATFGLPVFRHPPIREEIGKLIASTRLFPDRAHLVGAYALGKAQRMIALLRAQGYDRPIWLHGALEKLSDYYIAQGIDLGPLCKVAAEDRAKLAGEIVICPPSAMQDRWSRKFPDPIACFASGWMRVRARARQKGVELPLVVSDHADWDDLIATIRETGAGEVWLTHGEADALAHWCAGEGIAARPLNLLGYGEEEAQS
ncbi:MAG: ligase-associated DNA damage response exonuclease [Salinarimonas sp.]|nr:ligase-associated DNA damage response exonuclease [Salinarimonas sp.]